MTPEELRTHFPLLSETVYGKPLVYLDNAATAQRLDSVLEREAELSLHANANIHRAVHRLSSLATEAYESARDRVRSFLGAASR